MLIRDPRSYLTLDNGPTKNRDHNSRNNAARCNAVTSSCNSFLLSRPNRRAQTSRLRSIKQRSTFLYANAGASCRKPPGGTMKNARTSFFHRRIREILVIRAASFPSMPRLQ